MLTLSNSCRRVDALSNVCAPWQVAHRLEAVLDCDRVAVMDAGVVVEAGPPRALLTDPASRLSAMHQAAQR